MNDEIRQTKLRIWFVVAIGVGMTRYLLAEPNESDGNRRRPPPIIL